MARYVKAINPDADVPWRTKVQKDMEKLSGKNLSKFQSIFWVAAYLSPVYRVLLTSDTEKMKEVKKFLQSKSVICLAFVIIIAD